MDTHKPKKPFHGWREFLKKVGVHRSGGADRLGAEQSVEWLNWRFEALGLDTQKARVDVRNSLAYQTCVANHLA
jgi:hypothetical protein